MSDLDQVLAERARKRDTSRYRPILLLVIGLAAILFQVYVTLFLESLAYLELPLLVTVYFALMRRQPIGGMFIGAIIGLVQDSLSHQPIGLYGIVKTLVGYFAGTVSLRFDVENPIVRMILAFFFYFFHQFFYWMLLRALLGQPLPLDAQKIAIFGLLNAIVALPFYHLLDKMKVRA
jgi:rod shape-determining protein MreD